MQRGLIMKVVKESDYIEEIVFLLNTLCQYFDTDYKYWINFIDHSINIKLNSSRFATPFKIKIFIPSKDISKIYEH